MKYYKFYGPSQRMATIMVKVVATVVMVVMVVVVTVVEETKPESTAALQITQILIGAKQIYIATYTGHAITHLSIVQARHKDMKIRQPCLTE